VYLTRAWLLPAIPDPIVRLDVGEVSKAMGLLLLFAAIMLLASYSMIKKEKKKAAKEEGEISYNYPLILVEGAVVGVVTGLVGAGGGFLIIPALVLLAKLPMKQAVGTSLIIIATKSLMGFLGDMKTNASIDWQFLLVFSTVAVVGIITGSMLSKSISGDKLKPAFGWFVLVMGIYIIIKETIL
jgi:uncharacterized membrane protein YfcA